MRTKECSIYEDLMPLEMDGLLQTESSEQLHEHLNSCTHCQDLYQNLRNPISVPTQTESQSIDYLKTIRAKQRKRMFLTVSGIILALIIGGLLKLFVIGSEAKNYQRDFIAYSYKEGDKEKKSFTLKANLYSSGEVINRYRIFDKGNHYEVKLYTVLPSFLYKETNLRIDLPTDKEVHVSGDILYPDGRVATRYAIELYNARTPYVGDSTAVLNLLHLLQISRFSPFELTLETESRPYGLIVEFENDLSNNVVQLFDEAALLINLIDNVDEVQFVYQVEGGKAVVGLTREGFEKRFRKSSNGQSYSESAVTLQELLYRLKIDR